MHPTALSPEERSSVRPGEALTLATVAVVFAVVILTIAAYKIYQSDKAKVTTPEGFKFEWDL
ncbi:MAG: hypothetical protein SPI58_05515 [Candidatus Enteromonas sp.]|nr:hypothetical protein [Candidatus Enteromonas sp.]MDY6094478.1 hypothetical protein [Candidatus Enteromonas sp.]